ncbi:MAG: acetyl-CoA carboxylase biotin carboxylase subunit [Syntrophaceae bacterium]|nr:acetyl-CoA carboxylase biotin carboxylase subunit [Syntrophaceae bacterium]
MFDKILIANRGEIAVRIIRTCKLMGIKTVAVYSEVDFRSPYVQVADESCLIGPARAQESFLNPGKILEVAVSLGCQGVHPGYGFLSENPEFARMVLEAGLVFIGPTVEAIALLGDKMASKALAMKTGVPVVPGRQEPVANLDEALRTAKEIGFPVLLKPAAGGGGRGMRIVNDMTELPGALESCRTETQKSFGDDRIFVERFITRPRHIEIQIIGDNLGNIIHLGERECSIQRRYQKVIEETPSRAIHESLRNEMGKTACDLARAAGYTSAGTVEFILDAEKNYYFLEMNTRLQVEHPVTELVTGLDLVELQIRIAAGEPLNIEQEDVLIKGWAIEARICAEDPSRGFLPTTGMITRYAIPTGKNVRVDSGIDAGSVITIHYDSLLTKVSAWGANREEARKTLIRALNGYHVEGITTNLDFVNSVLSHPAFASAELSTNFIDEHFEDGQSRIPPSEQDLHYMTMAAVLVSHTRRNLVRDSLRPMSPHVGGAEPPPAIHKYVVRTSHNVFDVLLEGSEQNRRWNVTVNDKQYKVVAPEFEYYRRRLKLYIDGIANMFRLQYLDNHIKAYFCGIVRIFEIYTPLEWSLAHFMLRDIKPVQENSLKCPMPGLITAVIVEEGTQVRKGQELLRMESMKMESAVAAPRDGQIDKVLARPGQTVDTDEILITFKE